MATSSRCLLGLAIGALLIGAWLVAGHARPAPAAAEPRPVSRLAPAAAEPEALEATSDSPTDAPGVADPAPRSPVLPPPVPPAAETPGPAVLGTVVDERGTSVAGARVLFYDRPLYGPDQPDGPVEPASEATSAADGRFAFRVADDGRTRAIEVRADGFAPKSRNQLPGVDSPFELVPAVRLSGRVLGADPGSVRVQHATEGVDRSAWPLVSDGTGGYEVRDLPLGQPCVLVILPPNGVPWSEQVPIEERPEVVHDIELGDELVVEALVVDALDGRPVPGAVLRAGESEIPLAYADGRGRLTLRFVGFPARLLRDEPPPQDMLGGISEGTLHADGYLATATGLWNLSPDWTATGRLVPSARIEGRVLLADGAPAAGATVRWKEPLLVHDELGTLSNGPASRQTATDADGRFVLPNVVWGQPGASLSVEHPLGGRCEAYDVAPAGPGETRRLEFAFPGRGVLEGRVAWTGFPAGARTRLRAALEGRGGEPFVPHAARVRLLQRGDGLRVVDGGAPLDPAKVREVGVDERGRFGLGGLEPGVYLLEAYLAGDEQRPEREWAVVTEEGGSAPVTLGVHVPYRDRRGRLLDENGDPLANQALRYLPTTGYGESLALPGFLTGTDEDGAFTVRVFDLPELHWVASVERDGHALRRAVGADDLEWRIPAVVPVRLRLDRIEGPSAPLRWRGPAQDESGVSAILHCDAEGFADAELPVGELVLVLPPSRASGGSEATERAVSVPPEGGAELDLR